MDRTKLVKILKFILNKLEGKRLAWMVEVANLLLQGILVKEFKKGRQDKVELIRYHLSQIS